MSRNRGSKTYGNMKGGGSKTTRRQRERERKKERQTVQGSQAQG